eukprot:scaffold2195_cov333-Pavlova_lutheri.AAC.6
MAMMTRARRSAATISRALRQSYWLENTPEKPTEASWARQLRLASGTAKEGTGHAKGDASEEKKGEKKEEQEEKDEKKVLLEHALKHAAEKGWSRDAVRAAANDLGLSPSVGGMLERGDVELIEYFLDKCNRQLVQDLNAMEEELKEMRIRDKIKTAVKIRLEMLQPYVNVWPQALAILAQPRNVPGAVSKMAKMVDDIWIVAGDTSEDYNWYTKRGLLAGLYSSTELYMLTDTSPHFEDTWKFLDRRIEDIMVAGKATAQLGGFAKSVANDYDSMLRKIFSRRDS